MSSIILFTPENKPATKKESIKSLLLFQIIPIFILTITYLISLMETKKGNHDNLFEGLLLMGFILFSLTLVAFPLLVRVPLRIEILKNSKAVKTTFLNGYGTIKEDYIQIKNSKISYASVPKRPCTGKHLKISEYLFKKYITVSQTHGFTEKQLLNMFNQISELKN